MITDEMVRAGVQALVERGVDDDPEELEGDVRAVLEVAERLRRDTSAEERRRLERERARMRADAKRKAARAYVAGTPSP